MLHVLQTTAKNHGLQGCQGLIRVGNQANLKRIFLFLFHKFFGKKQWYSLHGTLLTQENPKKQIVIYIKYQIFFS